MTLAPQAAGHAPLPQFHSLAVMAAKLATSMTLLVIAMALVVANFDASSVFAGLDRLSVLTVSLILAALAANAVAAALRLKIIAGDVGDPLSYRQAIAAVSVGSLGGAAFFQIAGQLMARGVIMGRSGIPFAAVAVMTAYERIFAAVISGLLALAGAYFIFGHVILDRYAGGDVLIKLAGGLVAAIAAGALVGHGRITVRAIAPYMKLTVAVRMLNAAGLSLLVQLPMMAAYVVVAHALSPQTPVAEIAAASAIVMFAASVPISFAGWGVRETSAVIALGTIGVGAGNALVSAVIIGTGSILVMAVMAAGALSGRIHESQNESSARERIDHSRALAWTLPLAAATFVLFQIYVPMPSGTLLNVNLADPFAILAALLFVLNAVRSRRWPQWRLPRLNAVVAAATLVLAASLIHGAVAFGWTEWAVVNRFFGWFVLLAFAATAALIVQEGGEQARRLFLLTFAGATAAIAAIEVSLVLLDAFGIGLSFATTIFNVQGFAQNHNFFAFQLLMAIAATAVAARGATLRLVLLTLMFAGLFYSGSRSGWISLPFVVGAGIYLRAIGVREIAIAIISAAALVSIAFVPGFAVGGELPEIARGVAPTELNTAERMTSISVGLQLFADQPILGAGLGAFRSQMILSSSGIPLLIHSTTVWLLAETGIVGLLVFAVPALYLLFREARRARPDIASKLIVLSLIVFGCMSIPADMLYQRTFWLLIGAALALPKTGHAHERMTPQRDAS